MLAACFVFRAYGIERNNLLPYGGDMDDYVDLTRYTVVFAMVGAFILHVVVHCVLLYFVVPVLVAHKREKDGLAKEGAMLMSTTYKEIAPNSPCNWFNANPINCMRSRFIKKRAPNMPHCIPYQAGREYLLRVNENFGCFYERPDFCPEENASSEFMSIARGIKETAENKARDLAARARQAIPFGTSQSSVGEAATEWV